MLWLWLDWILFFRGSRALASFQSSCLHFCWQDCLLLCSELGWGTDLAVSCVRTSCTNVIASPRKAGVKKENEIVVRAAWALLLFNVWLQPLRPPQLLLELLVILCSAFKKETPESLYGYQKVWKCCAKPETLSLKQTFLLFCQTSWVQVSESEVHILCKEKSASFSCSVGTAGTLGIMLW